MPKTPDEIKKGLECHINGECNQSCPYFGIKFGCGPHMVPDALDLILQLEAQNDNIRQSFQRLKKVCVEQGNVIQQLETDKQQLEGMLTHMNQLRDAAAGRALKMEERVHQLEAERDAAVNDMGEMALQIGFIACDWCDRAGCELECSWSSSSPNFNWRGIQEEEQHDPQAAD